MWLKIVIKYLFAILTTNSDNAVKIDTWTFTSETKHLHFELDLVFISVVKYTDGGVSWATTLK